MGLNNSSRIACTIIHNYLITSYQCPILIACCNLLDGFMKILFTQLPDNQVESVGGRLKQTSVFGPTASKEAIKVLRRPPSFNSSFSFSLHHQLGLFLHRHMFK